MAKANEILELLASRGNVILAGPPGTGKSRLLAEVSQLFESPGHSSSPTFDQAAAVPIPAMPGSTLPGEIGAAANRKVFRCVLHQSSKQRDFLTGIVPDVGPEKPPGTFKVTEGILYRASEFALQDDHAALLIIDEINRGPAIQVFGGAIVAMEADKRLGPDGNPTNATQYFDLITPPSGELVEYAFPSRLYILAAMNQADVSVEPLDVAFLRRWTPFNLEPDASILRSHFGLPATPTSPLPLSASTAEEVSEAAVQAFEAINARIALGRGPEFRIGHGMLMAGGARPSNLSDALQHFSTAWRTMKNHIDEAFFGDLRGTAIILNADQGIPQNPYVFEETSFGAAPRALIRGPVTVEDAQVYDLFVALSKPAE